MKFTVSDTVRRFMRANISPVALESLAGTVFTCAIFYGDVFLGVTIPAAILLLPLVVLLRIPSMRRQRPVIPPGLILLSLTSLSVGLQTVFGFGPRGKTDLVVYLPLVYAGLTMVVLSGLRLSDHQLRRSLTASGLIAGSVLIGTLIFAERDFYAIPGQNPVVAQQRQDELHAVAQQRQDELYSNAQPQASNDNKPLPESAIPKISPVMQEYYSAKNLARTSLGMSNFLAVMFMFLFNVMLYQRSALAFLFGSLVFVTLSRSGVSFLLISVAFWIAHRHRRLREVAISVVVGGAFCFILSMAFWDHVRTVPGAESVVARLWFSTTALQPILMHPLIGAPRSETARQFGYPITWSPHNSVLHLLVLFGVGGTVVYIGYIGAVLRAIRKRAGTSPLWQGILAGFIITLIWSLIEIIVLNPPFEILIAAVYSLALTTNALSENPEVGSKDVTESVPLFAAKG